jgi:hypothetical protein
MAGQFYSLPKEVYSTKHITREEKYPLPLQSHIIIYLTFNRYETYTHHSVSAYHVRHHVRPGTEACCFSEE